MAEAGVTIIRPLDRGLRRHGDKVSCLKFSHNGKLFASGGFDKVVRIWDNPKVQEFRDGRMLMGGDAAISLLDFSPDDRLLASSCWDGTVHVWDLARGPAHFPEPISVLHGHKGAVNGVIFLPDGKRLVTCGEDGTIRVWDARSGKEEKRLDAQTTVLHLCPLPGGEQILTGYKTTSRGYLALWELETGTMSFGQYPLYAEGPACLHISFSSDSQYCAVCHPTGAICMWHLKDRRFTRQPTHRWKANHEAVYSVEFSPNSKLLATASEDQTAKLWDVRTQQAVAVCEGNTAAVYDVAFSPDGKLLATAGEDWIVHLWDLTTLPSEYLK